MMFLYMVNRGTEKEGPEKSSKWAGSQLDCEWIWRARLVTTGMGRGPATAPLQPELPGC